MNLLVQCFVLLCRNATSHFLCIIRKPSIKLVTGGSAALFAGCQVINWKKARCEALKVTTRFDVGSKLVAVQPEFSWRKLFEYLKPQLWQLIGAIVVSNLILGNHLYINVVSVKKGRNFIFSFAPCAHLFLPCRIHCNLFYSNLFEMFCPSIFNSFLINNSGPVLIFIWNKS